MTDKEPFEVVEPEDNKGSTTRDTIEAAPPITKESDEGDDRNDELKYGFGTQVVLTILGILFATVVMGGLGFAAGVLTAGIVWATGMNRE